MILIKHTDKLGKKEEKWNIEENINVFGGFTKTMWTDDGMINGDQDSSVFTVIPKFKVYRISWAPDSYKGICYLNTNKGDISNPKGLGFGGDGKGNFRLWIDENILAGSKVSSEDPFFPKGYLVDPAIKALNIDEIEIWGLGDLTTLRKQEELQGREPKVLESKGGFIGASDTDATNIFFRSTATNFDMPSGGLDTNKYSYPDSGARKSALGLNTSPGSPPTTFKTLSRNSNTAKMLGSDF